MTTTTKEMDKEDNSDQRGQGRQQRPKRRETITTKEDDMDDKSDQRGQEDNSNQRERRQ